MGNHHVAHYVAREVSAVGHTQAHRIIVRYRLSNRQGEWQVDGGAGGSPASRIAGSDRELVPPVPSTSHCQLTNVLAGFWSTEHRR